MSMSTCLYSRAPCLALYYLLCPFKINITRVPPVCIRLSTPHKKKGRSIFKHEHGACLSSCFLAVTVAFCLLVTYTYTDSRKISRTSLTLLVASNK